MRFDLRLHGRTNTGERCVTNVAVYADSLEDLKREADVAAQNAPWHAADDAAEWIAENPRR